MLKLRHSLGVLLLAASMQSASLAQNQGDAPPPGGATRAASPRSLLDLDFKGGTAVDFLDAVRQAVGDRVNIVAMPHVEEIAVPPMTLRRVDVVAAVMLLDGEHLESSNRLVMLRVQPVTGPSLGGDAAPLIKVDADVKVSGRYAAGPQRSNIWSVADLIAGGTSPDHIIKAVSTALELLGSDAQKAQVRFHTETALLLARAEIEQIEIIENVIDQLRRSSAQRREQSVEPIKREMLALQSQMEAAAKDRQAIEMEAVERLRLAETAKVRAEAMERRTAELEATVARLRDELMQRESIIRALEEQAARLREQAKSKPDGE